MNQGRKADYRHWEDLQVCTKGGVYNLFALRGSSNMMRCQGATHGSNFIGKF